VTGARAGPELSGGTPHDKAGLSLGTHIFCGDGFFFGGLAAVKDAV